MQDDITDGVNWLVDQGIADKERIAIYGGSYGRMLPLQVLHLRLIFMQQPSIMWVFRIFSPS